MKTCKHDGCDAEIPGATGKRGRPVAFCAEHGSSVERSRRSRPLVPKWRQNNRRGELADERRAARAANEAAFYAQYRDDVQDNYFRAKIERGLIDGKSRTKPTL
jgi:hypothetical protein